MSGPNRFDRELTDIFAIQDELTKEIVSALRCKLTVGEQDRMAPRRNVAVEAFELFLRGRERARAATRIGNIEARGLLERALAIDPNYAAAHAVVAMTHLLDYANGFRAIPNIRSRSGVKSPKAPVRMDEEEPHGHFVLGAALMWNCQYDAALAEAARGLALSPNSAEGLRMKAHIQVFAGDPAGALENVETYMKRDPHYPDIALQLVADARFARGEYELAITALEQRLARNSPIGDRPRPARRPATGSRPGGRVPKGVGGDAAHQSGLLDGAPPPRPAVPQPGRFRAARRGAAQGRRLGLTPPPPIVRCTIYGQELTPGRPCGLPRRGRNRGDAVAPTPVCARNAPELTPDTASPASAPAVSSRARRDLPARRNRRDFAELPGQAAARAPGGRVRAGRRARTLEGVRHVLCAKTGDCPKGVSEAAGIAASDAYAYEYAETAIGALYAQTFARAQEGSRLTRALRKTSRRGPSRGGLTREEWTPWPSRSSRPMHRLRRLRIRVPDRRHQVQERHLHRRSQDLHRMRGPFRHAAMRQRLPGAQDLREGLTGLERAACARAGRCARRRGRPVRLAGQSGVLRRLPLRRDARRRPVRPRQGLRHGPAGAKNRPSSPPIRRRRSAISPTPISRCARWRPEPPGDGGTRRRERLAPGAISPRYDCGASSAWTKA